MMRKNTISFILLSWLMTLIQTSNAAPHSAVNRSLTSETQIAQLLDEYGIGFANLEHRALGNQIELQFADTSRKRGARLTLPNGLALTYGEIVMYAGDMFGDPGHPVATCAEKDKADCFRRQFRALAIYQPQDENQCDNPARMVPRLADYLKDLDQRLQASRNQGVDDEEFYQQNAEDIFKNLNRLTCGGSRISDYFPFGAYINLAVVNYDHFLPDAAVAYQTGHREALQTALKAHQAAENGQPILAGQLLELAYAQNAFANHWLTDAFSAGHIRTPRVAIANQIALPAVLNLLIANLMHDEDNKIGLYVANKVGMSWKAHGDGRLFSADSREQREIMLTTMQISADAIYEAFRSGEMPATLPELDYLPDPDSLSRFNQSAPLFRVENGVLQKRVDPHNPYDYHWTSYWSGLWLLLQFKLGG